MIVKSRQKVHFLCWKQNKNNLKKWKISKNKYNKRLIQAEERSAHSNLRPK